MQDIFISIIFACMIVFPFFIASLARAQSTKRKEDALNEAIKRGHVVTAILKKRVSNVNDPYSRSANGMTDLGIYEYEWKGKKYKYKDYSDNLASTQKLYFLKCPRKAVPAGALASTKGNWLLRIAVIACVIYLFGRLSA